MHEQQARPFIHTRDFPGNSRFECIALAIVAVLDAWMHACVVT